MVDWMHWVATTNLQLTDFFDFISGWPRYGYQVTQGTNSQCGGADKWADVQSSQSIFCRAGFYCPTTTVQSNCSSGCVPIPKFSKILFRDAFQFQRGFS